MILKRDELETNGDRPNLGLSHGFAKRCRRPFQGVPGRDTIWDVPLFGRSEHHRVAPDIRAEIHQVAQVAGGSLADGGVRMRQVETFGLGQHPVNAGDADAGARRGVANPLTFARGNLGDVFRYGERGDFHRVVTGPGRAGEGVFELPAREDFVADREFHCAFCNACRQRRRVRIRTVKENGPFHPETTSVLVPRAGTGF